jgi:hypothetical protein
VKLADLSQQIWPIPNFFSAQKNLLASHFPADFIKTAENQLEKKIGKPLFQIEFENSPQKLSRNKSKSVWIDTSLYYYLKNVIAIIKNKSYLGCAPFFRTKTASAGRMDKNCVSRFLLSLCEGKSVWIDTSLRYYLKMLLPSKNKLAVILELLRSLNQKSRFRNRKPQQKIAVFWFVTKRTPR